MQTTKLFAAICTAFALAACGGGDKAPAAQTAPQPSAPAAATTPASSPAPAASTPAPAASAPAAAAQPVSQGDYRRDTALLQKIEDELKALPQFGGKPLHIFQDIHFYHGEKTGGSRIVVTLQDPNKPENVDAYEYRIAEGKWSEPAPVKLQGSGDMQPHLIPLAEAPFAKTADFFKLWDVRAKEVEFKGEEGPDLISLVQPTPKLRFYQANMPTDRANYMLRMNTDGTEKSFEK